jgi:hypothetical protein
MTRFPAVALQLFKTKSPDHLFAEAVAPERQMKRTLSLIAANAKTDREDAQPTDTTGAKTDSLRAVCPE